MRLCEFALGGCGRVTMRLYNCGGGVKRPAAIRINIVSSAVTCGRITMRPYGINGASQTFPVGGYPCTRPRCDVFGGCGFVGTHRDASAAPNIQRRHAVTCGGFAKRPYNCGGVVKRPAAVRINIVS